MIALLTATVKAAGPASRTVSPYYDSFDTNVFAVSTNAGTRSIKLTATATNGLAISNALVTLLVASDTTTSNGLYSVETTRNAAVSNGVVTLLVANDTTTSNGVVTLLVANDTTTSNGAVSFTMTASNTLRSTFVSNDTTTSNGVVALLVANDTTTSNALRTDISSLQTRASNLESVSNFFANGEVSKTNVTVMGLVYDQLTGTNRLRSIRAGNGLTFTNESTNIVAALTTDPTAYQPANAVLSNLVTNPYTSYTNLAMQVAANNVLSNLQSNPYVAYTNALTKTATTVSGAGNGNTNYLITLSTNGVNYFYLGSSNVLIYTVAGSTLGSPILWTAIITNLSANTWGFTVSAGTNRWKWQSYMYGTNRPITLTNNTALQLNGQSDGTNTLVNYLYYAPAL